MSNNKSLQERSKLPAKDGGFATVKQFFDANKTNMAAVLPKHLSSERMMKIALSALRTTPKLMECTTESLMGAVMQCAQFGLEPNTVLGSAYLIPFKNKQKGRTDVQVIIGYRGMIDLARRSGHVESIAAHAVYSNDEFSFSYGLDEHLRHVPAMDNRGEIVAFYCVVKLKGGGHGFEVMSVEAVKAIRDNSQGYKMAIRYGSSTPWKDNFEEMGRKTTVRRLFKYMPVSIEVATATAMDEVAETGGDQHLETVLEGDYQITPDDYGESVDEETGEITGAPDSAIEASAAPHAPDDPENPEYMSDDVFMGYYESIKSRVESGAKTPEEMIEWLKGRGSLLTAEQDKTVRSFEKVDQQEGDE